ncbi:MAG: transglycosylase [Clostridiales bacterium]|nr:transglycosylase [Clostridiales bacterium]
MRSTRTKASANGAFKKIFNKKTGNIALKALKVCLKGILTIFLIGTLTASIAGCVMFAYVITNFDGSEGIPDLKVINQNQSSIIKVLKKNGNPNNDNDFVEEQRVQGANRIWKSFHEIPVDMQNAVIAIEDERFKEHYGVDWKRTVSAFANLIFRFRDNEYGGSTITQQLIKNLTKDNETSITRKVREIFRAIKMERHYSTKEDILEAYLNILPLGRVSGVGAAANYFFAKEVEDLNVAECALIAGITQNPSKYNPYLHPDNAIQRQRVVLYKMYEEGYLNAEEYKQAYNQELFFKSSMKVIDVQDYYNDMITDEVINGLVETYGYSEDYAEQMFYYGGLTIYSAKNPEQQAAVQQVFENEKNYPAHRKGDEEEPQAAIAIIDYDGRIVATVGGRGEKTANRVLNRSIASTRQPGSAIKPIATYAPAIKYGLITYSTIFTNDKITLSNGKKWPDNYHKNIKYSPMPVEEALQRSLNTIPAQIMTKLTPQRSFDFLTKELHFTTLVKSARLADGIHTDIDYSPMTLGGFTYGVKCIEMAAAYQIFGNGGVYNKPYSFYRVKRNDEVILEHRPKSNQPIDEDTAYIMNRLLQRVINGSPGVATARGQEIGSFETFGKTGTTNDNKDFYFTGGTPYFVGACWFGYDNNDIMSEYQSAAAKNLWKKAMTAIHSGLPKKGFDKKGNTVETKYCYKTGKLATAVCPKTSVGVYKPEFLPEYCTEHG